MRDKKFFGIWTFARLIQKSKNIIKIMIITWYIERIKKCSAYMLIADVQTF